MRDRGGGVRRQAGDDGRGHRSSRVARSCRAGARRRGRAQCGYCIPAMVVRPPALFDPRRPPARGVRAARPPPLPLRHPSRGSSGRPPRPPRRPPTCSLLAALDQHPGSTLDPPDRRRRPTLFTGKVELGQGRSAIARIGADELDVSLERIASRRAIPHGAGRGLTAGSTVADRQRHRDAAGRSRRASALLALAAAGSTPRPTPRVGDGVVAPDGGRSRTGSCSPAGAGTVRRGAAAQGAGDYRFVGRAARGRRRRPRHRDDRFVHDLRAGMLFGARRAAPGPGARLEDVDVAWASFRASWRRLRRRLPRRRRRARGPGPAAHDALARGALAEEASCPPDRAPRLAPRATRATSASRRRARATPRRAGRAAPETHTAYAATFTRPYPMHGSIGPSAAGAVERRARSSPWSHIQGPFISALRSPTLSPWSPTRSRRHVAGPAATATTAPRTCRSTRRSWLARFRAARCWSRGARRRARVGALRRADAASWRRAWMPGRTSCTGATTSGGRRTTAAPSPAAGAAR